MTKAINALEYGEQILKTLSKGAFLTTAANGKQNTMTIGWGSLGFKWGVHLHRYGTPKPLHQGAH